MVEVRLRLRRGDISYVRYILEGYDGLGILTTHDAHAAQAFIRYPSDQEELLKSFIAALKDEGVIEEDY